MFDDILNNEVPKPEYAELRAFAQYILQHYLVKCEEIGYAVIA